MADSKTFDEYFSHFQKELSFQKLFFTGLFVKWAIWVFGSLAIAAITIGGFLLVADDKKDCRFPSAFANGNLKR